LQAGTIADTYEPHKHGRAFVYYTFGPLLGPSLGPIIGTFLNLVVVWTSNFYFLAIFCFITWVAIITGLSET
jgi:MFS family permease